MPETFTKWDAAEHLNTKEDVRLYLRSVRGGRPGRWQPDPRRPERRRTGAEHESAGPRRRYEP